MRVQTVLILVLMEDTLRVTSAKTQKLKTLIVLILVLMEDTLRENVTVLKNIATKGLNPCFNGRYSQSAKTCVPLFIVV